MKWQKAKIEFCVILLSIVLCYYFVYCPLYNQELLKFVITSLNLFCSRMILCGEVRSQ